MDLIKFLNKYFYLKMKNLKFSKLIAVVYFAFSSSIALATQSNLLCPNSKNTIEDTNCLSAQIGKKAEKLQKYLSTAKIQEKKDYGNDDELIETQKIWETYVSKHCGYIYSRQNGSARYRESAECTIRLYDERIYEVWKSYLTYFDSTPPVLPNPQIQD